MTVSRIERAGVPDTVVFHFLRVVRGGRDVQDEVIFEAYVGKHWSSIKSPFNLR